MSCPYCTPRYIEDLDLQTEDCYEYVYLDEDHNNTMLRTHLWRDEDEGSWWRTVLMADEWPERVDVSHFPVATSFPAPPYCPHCGRRLT